MYMTRKEMADELRWCMGVISEQNDLIAKLQEQNEIYQKALSFREEARQEAVAEAAVIAAPAQESEPQVEPTLHVPSEEDAPVTEGQITRQIRDRLEVDTGPMVTSYLYTPCKTCGVELKYSITRREKPDYCAKCKSNFRKDAKADTVKEGRSIRYTEAFYNMPAIAMSSYEPAYKDQKKTCDTCVYGKKCKSGVEGIKGFYCGAEQALSCRPGIVGAKYVKEEYTD